MRTRIKILGKNGSGLLSTCGIVASALKEMGYFLNADREYESVIKAGYGKASINFSDTPVRSLSNTADILVVMDKPSLKEYAHCLKDGGVCIHGYERPAGFKSFMADFTERGVKVLNVKARQISYSHGGNEQMINMVLTGMLWKALGFEYKWIEAQVQKRFASKPKLLAIDLLCLRDGFDAVEKQFDIALPQNNVKKIMLPGNQAIALGAAHAGMRCYFAYPMSPATSILDYVSKIAGKYNICIKQAEDEITVANMAIGAMHAGTRALAATSGGGYDLMTEAVSLAGIIECPLVIAIAQRPGPGTGLPTWTGQGDLNLATYSSHGEFARIVIGASNVTDCFELIQHAFNLAEVYQVPVIFLTEKVIAGGLETVPVFEQNKIEIQRGLVTGPDLENLESSDRFKITDDGVSKRWIPGSCETYYFSNGDEHREDGHLTEEAGPAGAMYAKRVRKTETIRSALPEPEIHGVERDADISFIGWGSSKSTMLDIIDLFKDDLKINYLHYEYLFPLKPEQAQKFFENNKNIHLIEGNYTGQFGAMIEAATKQDFAGKLLKWNGRPFFIEDVQAYITQHTS